jgi:hypothetical protein
MDVIEQLGARSLAPYVAYLRRSLADAVRERDELREHLSSDVGLMFMEDGSVLVETQIPAWPSHPLYLPPNGGGRIALRVKPEDAAVRERDVPLTELITAVVIFVAQMGDKKILDRPGAVWYYLRETGHFQMLQKALDAYKALQVSVDQE